jgi:hypothetical protein
MRTPVWKAGSSPIGAKLRDLHNAFSVMPVLVPGIHVVRGLARLQNPNAFGGGARRDSLGPALIVPTWMTGTSPVMMMWTAPPRGLSMPNRERWLLRFEGDRP